LQRSSIVQVRKNKDRKLRHGDVLRDVEYLENADIIHGKIELSKIVFPLIVVLTQDCDLTQDYKFRWSRDKVNDQDKFLISVLVAPLYNYDHFILGEHLEYLNQKMGIPNGRTVIQKIKNNKNPRFHFLEFPDSTNIVPSIIDFKHYFSVPVKYLKAHKKENFECQIAPIYREDLQQRFSSFLARIALPE